MIGISCINIIFYSVLTFAQPESPLESILKKYFDAVHIEELSKIKTLDMSGANFFFRNEDSYKQDEPFLIGTYRKVIVKNEKYYEKINDKVHNGSQTFLNEYCINKTDAWKKDGIGVKDWEFGSADSIVISSMIDIEGPLYNWKEKGHNLMLVGKRKISGKNYHCIKLTTKKNYNIYYYLDIKTGFIKWKSNNDEYNESYKNPVTFYSDYKEVDNVYFPLYIESRSSFMNETTYVVRKLETVAFNEKIDPALFIRPKE